MKKKIIVLAGIASLLTACGPEVLDNEANIAEGSLALDNASDNFIKYNGVYTEYGRCNDTYDNDGDGLVDMHDPDCHINAGPLRDLSLYDFPVGHNFFPDVSKIPVTSPGYPGGFRDRAQITKWFRFLTEPDGFTAGQKLFGPGVNNAVVPVPQPIDPLIKQGTYHQGNNNNVNPRALSEWFLDFSQPSVAKAPPAGTATEYKAPYPVLQADPSGAFPAGFYKGGSQGYLMPRATGNPDDGDIAPEVEDIE